MCHQAGEHMKCQEECSKHYRWLLRSLRLPRNTNINILNILAVKKQDRPSAEEATYHQTGTGRYLSYNRQLLPFSNLFLHTSTSSPTGHLEMSPSMLQQLEVIQETRRCGACWASLQDENLEAQFDLHSVAQPWQMFHMPLVGHVYAYLLQHYTNTALSTVWSVIHSRDCCKFIMNKNILTSWLHFCSSAKCKTRKQQTSDDLVSQHKPSQDLSQLLLTTRSYQQLMWLSEEIRALHGDKMLFTPPGSRGWKRDSK